MLAVFDPNETLIKHNTLMLWGNKDAALCYHTPEMEASLISGKVKLIRFDEGNHFLQLQMKEDVLKNIEHFLNE